MNITITNAAKDQLTKQFTARPEAYIRFGVRGGKCEGFVYVFEWAGSKEEADYLIEDGLIKLLIDKKSALYLEGTEIDYEAGLFKSGFKFSVPRQQSLCSCGESVSFK